MSLPHVQADGRARSAPISTCRVSPSRLACWRSNPGGIPSALLFPAVELKLPEDRSG